MRSSSFDTFRARCGLVVAFVSLVAPSRLLPAAAQGSAGSIIGQVTDESGAVLPASR